MKKGGLFLIFLVLSFVIGVYFKRIKNPPIVQPLIYNHKIHIENGLDCKDCHQHALDGVKATLPSIKICLSCHEEPITESREENKIREYAKSEGEIPWRKVLNLGDHVYFSHRRHVTLGEINCKTCHGEMSEMEKPPQRPLKNMNMKDCVRCHRDRKVTDDCNACHR